MATAFRAGSNNSATSGTAISVSAPTGTVAGDMVVIVTNVNGTSTSTTDNNGSTPFTKDSSISEYSSATYSQSSSITVWTRLIQSGDPTTFNFTSGASGRWGIIALTFSDPNTSSFWDVAPNTSNRNEGDNNSSAIDAPSITTTVDDAIHLAIGLQDSSSTSLTASPSGYSAGASAVNQPVAGYYKTISTAGATGTASNFNWNVAGYKTAFSMSIDPNNAVTDYSLSFNGASNYAQDADDSGYDIGTDTMTIECWVYCTDINLSSIQTYFKKDSQYILRMDSETPKFIVWADGTGIKDVSSSSTLTENAWTHIAGVYDGSEIRIYVDGTLKGTTSSVTGNVSTSANSAAIGAQPGGGEYFPGYIDEMRISDSVRYTGASFSVPTEKFVFDSNTISLWHFDDGTGSATLTDSGSNNLDMTFGSPAPTWSTETPGLTDPLMESLTENFDDNSIDTSKWVDNSSGQIVETNQQLELTSTVGAAYYNWQGYSLFNLTGSSIYAEIVDKGNQTLTSFEFYPLTVSLDASNEVGFSILGGNIGAWKKVAGSGSHNNTVAFNATTHKYVRIREASGTTYWEYSSDASSWSTLRSEANVFAVTALKAQMVVGTWQAEASTGTGIIDNINIAPAATGTISYMMLMGIGS